MYKDYWNKNIKEWADLYLDISHGHEEFQGSKIISHLYNRFVVPYESYLMKIRYKKTMEFINTFVSPGDRVSDIGCGTGVFAVHLLKKNATVNAIDISEKALEITKTYIENHAPEFKKNIKYYLADIEKDTIPKSDISILVGVLPYIKNAEVTLSKLLDSTSLIFFQFSSSQVFSNRIRKFLPFLNVRKLQFQSLLEIKKCCEAKKYEIIQTERFATGYLVIAKKRNYKV